ncbi:hypothetical protein Q5752_004511 [Cryptotrichosporon argae]
MLYLLPLLLCAYLIVRRACQSFGTQTRDGLCRPPRVPDWLPFVGSALSMAAGDGFWQRAELKHGSAVRIRAMGQTRVFALRPSLINYVYKNSDAFDFVHYRKLLQSTIFGLTMEQAFADMFDDHVFPSHHRLMQPGALAPVINSYLGLLEADLSSRSSGARGIDLAEVAREILYTNSCRAFFGRSFPAARLRPLFDAFDNTFPLLSLPLPACVRVCLLRPRERLLDELTAWLAAVGAHERDAMAAPVRMMLDAADAQGWDTRAQAGLVLAEFWALAANAPRAAAWTIAELVRRPAVVARARAELGAALASHALAIPALVRLAPAQLVAALPFLHDCLRETLRLRTSSFALRRVAHDVVVPAHVLGPAHAAGMRLCKGEDIVCVSRHNQVAPTGDWGADAGVWDVGRWDGKKGTMMPFGGGVSMCEGRHFAAVEIMAFVALWLHAFDTAVVADSLAPDMTRIGLGALQAKGALRVDVTPRAC